MAPQKQENSNTQTQEEKTKGEKTNPENTHGEKVAQGGSNNGQSSGPVRPATTLTPFQAHITTKPIQAHVTATSHIQQPSNGPCSASLQCLPKSGLALERAPHTPITAEQFGIKGTIKQEGVSCPGPQPAKVSIVKRNGVEYTICHEENNQPKNTAAAAGAAAAAAQLKPPVKEQKEQKAMHPSLTTFLLKGHGSALTHEGPIKVAKTVQKVAGETLEAGKALLGIKGK